MKRNKFKTKPEIDLLVDRLWASFGHRLRGDTIPWGEIETIIGPRRRAPGASALARFRRKLRRERNIVTEADGISRGAGLYLELESDRVTIRQTRRHKRAWRALTREVAVVRETDGSALTDHQRRLRTLHEDGLTRSRRILRQTLNEAKKEPKVSETLPR